MATYCSILAWRIPWTEEVGRLQFMGSQRIGHKLVTEHTQIYNQSLLKKELLATIVCSVVMKSLNGIVTKLFRVQPHHKAYEYLFEMK